MSKVTITPRGKYVLIKPEGEPERENEHGLIIPDTVEQEQKAEGVIVNAGAVTDLKKGDRVVYGAYSGETMKVKEGSKEVEYKLVHDEDIIAVIA